MLNLKALALPFRRRLVVGHLPNDSRDGSAEGLLDLLNGRPGVLDRVVQQRGNENGRITLAAVVCQEIS